MQARHAVRGAVETALGPGSTVRDMARVYQEQVASQVAVQAQAVPLAETCTRWRPQHPGYGGNICTCMYGQILPHYGICWTRRCRSSTPAAHRSTGRTQLRLMNGLRSDSAAWAVRRWYRRATGSVEDRLVKLFEEIWEEVVDVTAGVRRGGPREALSLPWAEWTHQVVHSSTQAEEASSGGETRTLTLWRSVGLLFYMLLHRH